MKTDFEPNYNSDMKISTIIREGERDSANMNDHRWKRIKYKKVPDVVRYTR